MAVETEKESGREKVKSLWGSPTILDHENGMAYKQGVMDSRRALTIQVAHAMSDIALEPIGIRALQFQKIRAETPEDPVPSFIERWKGRRILASKIEPVDELTKAARRKPNSPEARNHDDRVAPHFKTVKDVLKSVGLEGLDVDAGRNYIVTTDGKVVLAEVLHDREGKININAFKPGDFDAETAAKLRALHVDYQKRMAVLERFKAAQIRQKHGVRE